jgi:hypothetical protein
MEMDLASVAAIGACEWISRRDVAEVDGVVAEVDWVVAEVDRVCAPSWWP